MSKKAFQYVIAAGMLMIVGPLVLKHTGVVLNDFTDGLLSGAGMGCVLLAVIKMPRKIVEK
ncbi:hypothetical protein GRF59_18950 [Paenibacillus sp. HJL G12]|uniref:Uncharacterized protein n=1 Tax=Paenibacillus dendrobii TaxID=2691084 RepID=A0A7X3LHC8_9BACL|nr:hypothetical protein [Paenibacillus dendrobii]MWV45696.1 hypothetical protein [Paenibacillus dendrobii]